MIKIGLISFFLFSITIFSQDNSELSNDTVTTSQQIINKGKMVIGTENRTVESISIKLRIKFDEKLKGNSTQETKVVLPDKISVISNVILPPSSPMLVTSIWNKDKYKAIVESEFMGERMVSDISNPSTNNQAMNKLGETVGKEKLEKYKSIKKRDPKDQVYSDIWKVFFGLTLIQPFESDLKFNYVGKAKSGEITANVIDVKDKNGKNYRLLFDIDKNYLLMMIQSYRGETMFSGQTGLYETKYYYSNREKVGDLFIPKKIKVEYKFTPDGKEPKITYENIDILEFKINPELNESLFEIK